MIQGTWSNDIPTSHFRGGDGYLRAGRIGPALPHVCTRKLHRHLFANDLHPAVVEKERGTGAAQLALLTVIVARDQDRRGAADLVRSVQGGASQLQTQ